MSANPELVQQARSSDPDARQKAAYQVSHSTDARDFPLMFELLGDKDWRVRKTIVDGFVRDPRGEVIERLLDALGDAENAGRRNSATEALVRIGEASIPAVVQRLLRRPDADIRLSLVNLLGDLRTREGFEALCETLGDESDTNVASSIIASLGKFRDAGAIPMLVRVLERNDTWLKFHAVEALGEIGDRTALPGILPLYQEKSLRKPVLEAVGKIGDVGTVNFLLKVIADEEKLNLAALRALVRIAEASKPRIVEKNDRELIQRKFRQSFPPSKVGPLIEQVQTTSKREVRAFILKFLGWTSDERALPVLLAHLEQPETSEIAAQALIDFGPLAIPPILDALQNAQEDEVVALLLRVINAVGSGESIPAVIPFLDHDNAMIRRLAIETLGELMHPGPIDYLLARLDDPDVAAQQAAVNAVSALVTAFPEVKPAVLGRIRKLLQSKSTPTKLNALSIYVNIQGEGYPDELLLASKDSDPAIRQKAVSLMGKFSEERFGDQMVLSLADETPAVRLAAINAVVRLRPEKGIEPLISSGGQRRVDPHCGGAGAWGVPAGERHRAAAAASGERSASGAHRGHRSAGESGSGERAQRAVPLRGGSRRRDPTGGHPGAGADSWRGRLPADPRCAARSGLADPRRGGDLAGPPGRREGSAVAASGTGRRRHVRAGISGRGPRPHPRALVVRASVPRAGERRDPGRSVRRSHPSQRPLPRPARTRMADGRQPAGGGDRRDPVGDEIVNARQRMTSDG